MQGTNTETCTGVCKDMPRRQLHCPHWFGFRRLGNRHTSEIQSRINTLRCVVANVDSKAQTLRHDRHARRVAGGSSRSCLSDAAVGRRNLVAISEECQDWCECTSQTQPACTRSSWAMSSGLPASQRSVGGNGVTAEGGAQPQRILELHLSAARYGSTVMHAKGVSIHVMTMTNGCRGL